MSVSTNLIAIPAMRIAALLGPFDRNGEGRLMEVYPAAALFVWDLPYRGYKGHGIEQRAVRRDLVRRLREQTSRWLDADASDWSADRAKRPCARRAHRVIGCAREALRTLRGERRTAKSDRARREGWIALPLDDALPQLGVDREARD